MDKQARVTVLIGDDSRHLDIPSGSTEVVTLKQELSVSETDVLYLLHGQNRRLLGDHEMVDVESGEHFEAIPAGGVS